MATKPAAVDTGKDAPAWMAHVDKLPPQVQEPLKIWIGDLQGQPNEPQARSQAGALALLQLWAVSSCPWFALLAAVVALVNPQLVAKTLLPVPGYITKGFKALPPLTPLPAVAGLIVILNVVGYLSYYLDWIVLFVWMGLSMYFSADLTIGVWKKEQESLKEAEKTE